MRVANEWHEAQQRATRDVARTVRLFEIAPADGTVPWGPVSNLNFNVFINGQRDIRSYSLVGEPEEDYRVAVKLRPDSRAGWSCWWRL